MHCDKLLDSVLIYWVSAFQSAKSLYKHEDKLLYSALLNRPLTERWTLLSDIFHQIQKSFNWRIFRKDSTYCQHFYLMTVHIHWYYRMHTIPLLPVQESCVLYEHRHEQYISNLELFSSQLSDQYSSYQVIIHTGKTLRKMLCFSKIY